MDIDLSFLENIGLDTKSGMEYTGGKIKYIAMLQRFYKNLEKNRDRLDEFYSSGDLQNFMVVVHALKSNAIMIGAKELSSSFAKLEEASKAGDRKYVEEHTAPVLANYIELVEKLRPIGEAGEVHAPDELDGPMALRVADDLIKALDDFDDELSKELANKLMGYPFRISQKNRLGEAIGFIDDFMYDEALSIIREIYPNIE
ncbi:MAG: Hpt domain-containing protein [Butyrivibrio sp.]|nr:Hpt domain-containing protein [Butyrivibrio sp.]